MAKNEDLREFLEASDVARELEISYSGVRVVVDGGHLKPAAVTRRGVRLFDVAAVERLKQLREEQKIARTK